MVSDGRSEIEQRRTVNKMRRRTPGLADWYSIRLKFFSDDHIKHPLSLCSLVGACFTRHGPSNSPEHGIKALWDCNFEFRNSFASICGTVQWNADDHQEVSSTEMCGCRAMHSAQLLRRYFPFRERDSGLETRVTKQCSQSVTSSFILKERKF